MNIKTSSELTKLLIKFNKPKYNISKAVEELQELSLILTQRLNKPTKVKNQDIIDEIGDVEIRLAVLKKIFSKASIQKRINLKEKDLLTKFKEGKYKGKL